MQKDGSLMLKRTHNYYYQAQAAMFCTGCQWCDFVVRTSVDLHVERVPFDANFWKSVLQQLHFFYFSAILPEIAAPKVHTGGIREPSDWINNQKSWEQKTAGL